MKIPYSKKTSRLTFGRALITANPIVVCILLVTAVGLSSFRISLAQKRADRTISVSGISTYPTPVGAVISIDADAPLSRAQTWQDTEGFHVVVPNAAAWDSVNPGRGVKIRQLGKSVEILLQTKPGSTVSVQQVNNRLNLTVDSKLNFRTVESEAERTPDSNERFTKSGRMQNSTPYTATPSPKQKFPTYSDSTTSFPSTGNPQSPNGNGAVGGFFAGLNRAPPLRGIEEQTIREGGNNEQIPLENGPVASVFSGNSALVVLGLGIVGVFAVRRLRSWESIGKDAALDSVVDDFYPERLDRNDARLNESWPESERNSASPKANRSLPAYESAQEQKRAGRHPTTMPASLYGAYRIDQEVGKLVFGYGHRTDVLASRARDDRRAIETSLIKIITSPDSGEKERRRAQVALEEYGFVARHCAALLQSPEAFDRTSAARSLGEIGSASALPFLLEGLNDFESIVRNQVVVSIGELKMPSAIGALLDLASKHPDVPSRLVSRALSSCSVEGLDSPDGTSTWSPLGPFPHDAGNFEITHLEPASSVEDLPASSVHPNLKHALSMLVSPDQNERTQAVNILAEYQVQSSVKALAAVARLDAEANVRAAAISSLASINHESVFPAVLIGLADESREVRAAAARSLSSLSFDRSDAYARVIETSCEDDLRDVADACIKSGIVSQNIDRLASNDRRQAYEVFCLICLLAKAKMTEPVVAAVCNHPSISVRLSAIHLLAMTGDADVFERLCQLAANDGAAGEVKTALLEVTSNRPGQNLRSAGKSSGLKDVSIDFRSIDSQKTALDSPPLKIERPADKVQLGFSGLETSDN